MLTLWQTAMLRLSRLRVRDEINEALRYYRPSGLIGAVVSHARGWGLHRDQVLLRMGSWIGGDRDGNPFVTADVLRLAVDRQTETALEHHLRALAGLGRELSMSSRLVTPTGALQALADASGDESPFRADEPYRRALRGMHARLAGDRALALLGRIPGPPPTPHWLPTAAPASSSLISTWCSRRWPPTGRPPSAAPAWHPCAGRCGCSASTCARSISARTPTCTRWSWASCSLPPA